MDLGTLTGLLLGVLFIVGSIMLGGTIFAFIDMPSVLITIGGSGAALLITYPLPKIKSVFSYLHQFYHIFQVNKKQQKLFHLYPMQQLSFFFLIAFVFYV